MVLKNLSIYFSIISLLLEKVSTKSKNISLLFEKVSMGVSVV